MVRACGTCNGTGRQPCRWERGFPVVQVAEMRQVWWHVSDYRTPSALSWEPTPLMIALLCGYHIIGVELPAEYVLTRDNVPPAVWDRIKPDDHFAPQFARAVVLAAIEWLDAQPAALPVSNGR